MIKERRRSPRAKCDFIVQYEYRETDVSARVVNISSSGMYMESNLPVPLFREISIGIKLPGIEELIDCTGVVVRSEKVSAKERYNLAIFFSDIQPEDKNLLSDYVKKQSAG